MRERVRCEQLGREKIKKLSPFAHGTGPRVGNLIFPKGVFLLGFISLVPGSPLPSAGVAAFPAAIAWALLSRVRYPICCMSVFYFVKVVSCDSDRPSSPALLVLWQTLRFVAVRRSEQSGQ